MISYVLIAALAITSCYGQAEFEKNPICTHRSGYYKIEGNCDSYIECKDYIAHEMLCPDGLHFNPEAQWPAYPCGYPMDVPCLDRKAQPAIPTADCPHQYGFFPSPIANPNDCGQYRMCVEGRAIEMMCPPGLAFNPVNARCDWPEFVESCNVDAFLGFKCPEAPRGIEGEFLDVVLNFRSEDSCYAFYSCERGRARLLSCDAGFAFDPATGHCEDAEKVICETYKAVLQ